MAKCIILFSKNCMSKNILHLLLTSFLFLIGCGSPNNMNVVSSEKITDQRVASINFDTLQIISSAEKYLQRNPTTITAFRAERSIGGIHDYYSEGSYWWINPEDPTGPFIRKDGERNPNNFIEHKKVLREFCVIVSTLTAAYKLTSDERYANHAIKHIQAWFVNTSTKMNPHLLYAQAIKGISSGRGIGIIDTVRLIDVALSVLFLKEKGILKDESLADVKKWFNAYCDWLTSHSYGIDERDQNNNHSTWWGAQVAAYAAVAERDDVIKLCQNEFKKQLNIQMAEDGSFPEEISRTRPFHYMNYNLRAWSTYALLASTKTENLWAYKSNNGTLQKAIDYIIPYYKSPGTWKYLTALEKEILPHQNDFLVFSYWGLGKKEYLELWKDLPKNKNKIGAGDENLVLYENHISK